MFNKKLKRRLAELENLLGYAWIDAGGYNNHEKLNYGDITIIEKRLDKLETNKK